MSRESGERCGQRETNIVHVENSTNYPQQVFGSPMTFTIEPKNVQTLLATQFKDFGLGEWRNGNFNPLLGHGIVSNYHDQFVGTDHLSILTLM